MLNLWILMKVQTEMKLNLRLFPPIQAIVPFFHPIWFCFLHKAWFFPVKFQALFFLQWRKILPALQSRSRYPRFPSREPLFPFPLYKSVPFSLCYDALSFLSLYLSLQPSSQFPISPFPLSIGYSCQEKE